MEIVAIALIMIVFIINLSPFWDEEAKKKLRVEKESTERRVQQIHDEEIPLDIEVNASDILTSAFLETFKWTMIIGCGVALLSTCSGGAETNWCGRAAC